MSTAKQREVIKEKVKIQSAKYKHNQPVNGVHFIIAHLFSGANKQTNKQHKTALKIKITIF